MNECYILPWEVAIKYVTSPVSEINENKNIDQIHNGHDHIAVKHLKGTPHLPFVQSQHWYSSTS